MSMLLFFVRGLILLLFALLFVVSLTRPGEAGTPACRNGASPARVILAGDLLIGGGLVWDEIVAGEYGPGILGPYHALLRESDVVFANFEGAISGDIQPRNKNLPRRFSLRTDPAIVTFLENLGPLVLSFANNHSADYGETGVSNTVAAFRESDVAYVGIGRDRHDASSAVIRDVSGVRVAFLAFTDLLPESSYASETRGGVAKLSDENLRAAVAAAKKSSDFIIVSLHTAADVRKAYSFWPDTHQREYARLAIDSGADMVVGQHPHGLQSVEVYNGKPILHSLGLFVYDPAVPERYAASDPLYPGTRFEGGAVAEATICREGLRGLALFPSRTIKSDNRLVVAPDNSLSALLKISFIRLQLFLPLWIPAVAHRTAL